MNWYELLDPLKNAGLSLIYSLYNFGYNFFFTTINDWLGINFGTFGDVTLFHFFLISGLTFWISYKLVKWIMF